MAASIQNTNREKKLGLSKSRYCSGLQCPKILWMKQNMPEQFDESVMNQSILAAGNEVGDLAMGYFGEFVEVPFNDDKSLMIKKTQELIKQGIPIITEASFSYDGNFFSADILRNDPDGLHIVEVKSSTSLKPIYLDDMAYQCYVLRQNGYSVKAVSLMHLNNQYVRYGELDLNELFVLEDHTEEVFSLQDEIPGNINHIRALAQQSDEPTLDIGLHCNDPYECGYKGYCWRHIPENSVFDIARLRSIDKFNCYQNGIVTLEQVIDAGIKLNNKQKKQVSAEVKQLPPSVDLVQIKAFLASLTYPLYLLDFETYQQKIPLWDGIKPWMQVPFQFSLHILKHQGAEPIHREFLGEEGTDPRRELAERLCAEIPDDVSTLAYNMVFEKGRIKELAGLYPDLAAHLMTIHDNMADLMTPFQVGSYFDRRFKGSYSIKKVLPTLCPDDPELNYETLDLIHNGTEASEQYETLHLKEAEERAQIRRSLLAYCRLDTLAMVKILEKLYEVVEG